MPTHLALVSTQPSTRQVARDAVDAYRERHPVLQHLVQLDLMNQLVGEVGVLGALDLLREVAALRGESL